MATPLAPAPEGDAAPGPAPAGTLTTGGRGVLRELLALLPNLARLIWGLARDSRVSLVDKALVLGALAYLVMPLDLIPDVIPFFGELDDAAVLFLTVRRLLRRATPDVIAAHWKGDPAWLTDSGMARVLGAAAWILPGGKLRSRTKRPGRRTAGGG